MSDVCWLPIKYRDFYDIPRMFVVENCGKVFLFDCAFDVQVDDYPTKYVIYQLRADSIESVNVNDDWRALPEQGTRVSTVDLEELKFDPTKRQFVDGSIFGHLKLD
jgi:hypothetical protein